MGSYFSVRRKATTDLGNGHRTTYGSEEFEKVAVKGDRHTVSVGLAPVCDCVSTGVLDAIMCIRLQGIISDKVRQCSFLTGRIFYLWCCIFEGKASRPYFPRGHIGSTIWKAPTVALQKSQSMVWSHSPWHVTTAFRCKLQRQKIKTREQCSPHRWQT